MFTNVVPSIKLVNGQTIPAFGLGTWKLKPFQATQAVCDAIDIGYRLFDCAFIYNNEKEVGKGIKEKIDKGVIQRENIYVVSKLWNTYHRPDLVEPALKMTLFNLGLDYLDLYLIHWPFALKEDGDQYPMDNNGKFIYSDIDYVDTWKAMEELYLKGLVKSIGISNFNRKQLDRICKHSKTVPVVNQIECHPYLTQNKMSNYLQSKGITLMSYSPLGCRDRPWAKPEDKVVLEDPKLSRIADRHRKSAAQVALRYQIQRGHIVIPKSVNRERLRENFEIFDFELSKDDMKTINALSCNVRYCPFDEASDHKDYPFGTRDEY